jgi:RNase P subunit RPR2
MSQKRTIEIIHCPKCDMHINVMDNAFICHSTNDPQAPTLFIACPSCGYEKRLQAHVLPLPCEHAAVAFNAVIQLLAVAFANEKRIRIEPAYDVSAAPNQTKEA